MLRIEINIYEKKKELCVKLVTYNDYSEMHVQQNIKFKILFVPVTFVLISELLKF